MCSWWNESNYTTRGIYWNVILNINFVEINLIWNKSCVKESFCTQCVGWAHLKLVMETSGLIFLFRFTLTHWPYFSPSDPLFLKLILDWFSHNVLPSLLFFKAWSFFEHQGLSPPLLSVSPYFCCFFFFLISHWKPETIMSSQMSLLVNSCIIIHITSKVEYPLSLSSCMYLWL